MAAAGQAWWTVDAGGFFRPGKGQYTDPAYQERFLRWFQFAKVLPMTHVHGYMTDTEFWRYGDTVERVARFYLELRYRLLPYTHALAAEASAAGMPLIRPLVFDFPNDPEALDQVHAYMFGSAIHVAPVLAAGVETWDVYLPVSEGGWYDFWTGEHRQGGRTHTVPVALDRIPLHVRMAYPGMTESRAIRAHLMRPGNSALSISSGVAVDYAARAKQMILGT
jgi:alpha-D-xyloside xylohydrolase